MKRNPPVISIVHSLNSVFEKRHNYHTGFVFHCTPVTFFFLRPLTLLSVRRFRSAYEASSTLPQYSQGVESNVIG